MSEISDEQFIEERKLKDILDEKLLLTNSQIKYNKEDEFILKKTGSKSIDFYWLTNRWSSVKVSKFKEQEEEQEIPESVS